MKLPTLKKSLRSLGKAPVLAAEAGAPSRSRLLGIGALAAVGVLAAVFFLRPADTRTPAAESPTGTAGVQTAELTLGYTPADGFNPYLVNSSLVLQNSGLLFERLVEVTPSMDLDYRLAQSIDTTDTQVIINLRGGCYFADGTPISIADVAASLEAARASSIYGGRFSNVETVQVVENSLVLSLHSPDSLFAYLCDIPILKADEAYSSHPTASGRYTYGSDDTLVRNSRAPFAENGPAQIRLSTVNSYDEMVSGLAVGNLNLYSAAHDGSGSAGSGKESYYKTNQLVYLGVNSASSKPILAAPAGRQLLSAMANRRQLAEKSYYSRAYPATGAVNSFYPCVNSQQVILAEADTASPDEAMAALGYVRGEDSLWHKANPDGSPGEALSLSLLYFDNGSYRSYAAALYAQQLLAQGITLNVVQADSFEQYQQAVQSGDFELYIGEVKLYNNIDLGPFWAGGALSAGLAQSEELAAAYSAFKANKSAAGQFEQAFAAQMPYIPLLWRYNTVISGFGVQGLTSSVSNVFYSVAGLSVTVPD